MWRTWIRIESGDQPSFKMFQDTIRQRIQPILQLQKNGEVNWFYFLYHSKPDDPANLYFDVVFTTERETPDEILPEYCIGTQKIPPITSISGIDEKILLGEDIRKAWRIIGEQSEFMINMVCSYNENNEIPPIQIAQYMHFFMNQLGYGQKSLFFPRAYPDKISQAASQVAAILGGEWIRF
jgi:hypothetical protein